MFLKSDAGNFVFVILDTFRYTGTDALCERKRIVKLQKNMCKGCCDRDIFNSVFFKCM